MTPVDIWAAAAAAVAALAVGLRRWMLNPSHATWANAPGPVQAGLSILTLVLCMRFLSLCSGRLPANEGEATIYTVLALVSVIMVWNLHATGREHRPR